MSNLYFWYHEILHTKIDDPLKQEEQNIEIHYETKSAEEIKELSDKLQRKFCYDYR